MTNKYFNYFCGEDGYCDNYDEAQIVVVPVPYDGTSTWQKGADRGPASLIEASGTLEMYDIETGTEVYKRGIFTAPAVTEDASPEAMSLEVEKTIGRYLDEGRFPVLLGGEHSVSIGAIHAFAKRYDDLTILQFDAHADMRPDYEGSAYNHACVMARAQEVAQVLQVGIRSMCVEDKENSDLSRVFFRYQMHGNPGWLNEMLSKLTGKVYITIDLDCFDPSVIPGTGTPEPDGMTYREVLDVIKAVNQQCEIVGLDVVELLPLENNKVSEFAAAKLVYQILSHRFQNR